MEKHLRTEFYVNGEGELWMRDERGDRRCLQGDVATIGYVNKRLKAIYPEAYKTLAALYRKSERSRMAHEYKIAARFIRCNMGEDDKLKFDLEGGRLNLENVKCPLKGSGDCPLEGVICDPKPTGFTAKEREVVVPYAHGLPVSAIAQRLGRSVSTVKSHLQRIKKRFNLASCRDIIGLAYAYNLV